MRAAKYYLSMISKVTTVFLPKSMNNPILEHVEASCGSRRQRTRYQKPPIVRKRDPSAIEEGVNMRRQQQPIEDVQSLIVSITG